MRDNFETLAAHLDHHIAPEETYTLWFEGECSDFVRFNYGRVRQPGSVMQSHATLTLIHRQRQAHSEITLSGDPATDRQRASAALGRLRQVLPSMPEDPHLLINTSPSSSDMGRAKALPEAQDLTENVVAISKGHDMVGLLALGPTYRGFANSLGQRNWFEKASFNLDFSLYHRADKAVKASYAGFTWSDAALAAKMDSAQKQLAKLSAPAQDLTPGSYRVYLAPAAMVEILGLLAWNAFGLKSHRSKQTCLLRMIEEQATFSRKLTLVENTEGGAGPAFSSDGFIKALKTPLISEGRLTGALVSPRSAKEYAVPTTGAEAHEYPSSLSMQGGTLPASEAVAALDTGIFINNLWYLNYSDPAACRLTGMTRFASFWVEGGKIIAPLNVMRFDDSLFRMLGSELEDFSQETEFVFDPDTYERRSTGCYEVPGALVRSLALTL